MSLFPAEQSFVRCGKRLTTIQGSLFLVSKPAFECNSSIAVGTVGNTCSRVPLDSVACF